MKKPYGEGQGSDKEAFGVVKSGRQPSLPQYVLGRVLTIPFQGSATTLMHGTAALFGQFTKLVIR